MRILLDATPLQTGHRQRGVGTYTRELLRALLSVDRENDYLLIVHDRDGLPLLPANASLVYLPRPPLGRLTGFVSHQMFLPALLRRQRADLFHSPGFVAAFSVPGVPWHCPLPWVVTLHDFIPLHVPALFNDKAINRWWYRRQMGLAGRADRLICVSEATRQDALHWLGLPAERCVVVHEGVDRQVFRPFQKEEATGSQPYVLFVGGDYPNKNRQAALAAFAQLVVKHGLPHFLVLVGQDDTSNRELKRRYPELDLGRIRRLSGLKQAELAELYRGADLFLFPSTCEGFGLPVLEAMASGTPVITSTVSSLPEVAGNAAILVDPHQIEPIVTAMHRVLTDRSLHGNLVAAGLDRAAVFSWETMAQRTLDIYRQVTSRPV